MTDIAARRDPGDQLAQNRIGENLVALHHLIAMILAVHNWLRRARISTAPHKLVGRQNCGFLIEAVKTARQSGDLTNRVRLSRVSPLCER
jgi:hypothetical protein